ncbi:MAG: tRNA pseudouridine(54/55) synthase Pus10 [Candidatus Caldarchaeum sp.]|nr:tRNA pseudouridine(54/55) synthase Pus10 [Candidatus Caldarchaeum sp.]MDW8062742.1 tRNA pseudouridine(54/55) synthase Pus10 [Candidatus Caldarchaeum sp.]MDW8434644.1 tRNA pseudouridine(54/55) synthase Pus10 [Candidatus Caldarchaeum sp.]
METVLEQTALLLRNMALCDYCLGRQFARISPTINNREKGRALKLALFLEAVKKQEQELITLLASNGGLDEAIHHLRLTETTKKGCDICGGLLNETKFKGLAEKAADLLTSHEFTTFLVGAKASAEVIEREDRLRSVVGISEGEDIRNDVKREVAKIFAELTGKKIEYASPDVVITVDIFRDRVDVFPNPVFVKGRYLKHSRELPQSVWHCGYCWGRGCEKCGYTGRKYPLSVAELVGEPAKHIYGAVDYKFHAAGREDVDALVAGEGRPFILELKKPVKRNLPLHEVEKQINENAKGLVTVLLEGYSTRKEVRAIKLTSPATAKTYLLTAVYDVDLDEQAVKALETRFRNVVVDQLTPTRVLRRRREKLRKKLVYEVEAVLADRRTAVFRIRCQGGLYVKELVTGDNGRTRPSFAEYLGAVPASMELTVVKVET